MLSELFTTTAAGASFDVGFFLVCTLASLVLGVVIAIAYTFHTTANKSFVVTLALLPAIVQMVIMLVNGNLGTGVAVMGAFSLIRFRSVPGNAKDIASIFLAMAVGIATGMGYLLPAGLFVLILIVANLALTASPLGNTKRQNRRLCVTIPENLNYMTIFDDLFDTYTVSHTLTQVKTTHMGSLYKLQYEILLLDAAQEKEFLDAIRCRNGNLEITCGPVSSEKVEL